MASHGTNRALQPAADVRPLCPARTSGPGMAYSEVEVPDTTFGIVMFENRLPALMLVPADVPDAEPDS